MADRTPLAKRVKFDFTETLEVLVGKDTGQQCFTVHRHLFTQRSKFLEAASSSRWNYGADKPIDLTEHAPEVFASYMQCVYLGSVTVPTLPEDYDGDFGGLFALYLLADKLDDIITANLVIDGIMRMSEELRRVPKGVAITQAYGSTAAGNSLRKLCRDYYVHEATTEVLESMREDSFPFQYSQDVMLEFARLARNKTPYDGRVKVKCVDRGKCYYHRHDDEHPKCC